MEELRALNKVESPSRFPQLPLGLPLYAGVALRNSPSVSGLFVWRDAPQLLTPCVCSQLVLDEEDKKDRFKAAQEPKKYVASGGLTGFRVADDLFKMHLDYTEAAVDPEAWREPPKPKKAA